MKKLYLLSVAAFALSMFVTPNIYGDIGFDDFAKEEGIVPHVSFVPKDPSAIPADEDPSAPELNKVQSGTAGNMVFDEFVSQDPDVETKASSDSIKPSSLSDGQKDFFNALLHKKAADVNSARKVFETIHSQEMHADIVWLLDQIASKAGYLGLVDPTAASAVFGASVLKTALTSEFDDAAYNAAKNAAFAGSFYFVNQLINADITGKLATSLKYAAHVDNVQSQPIKTAMVKFADKFSEFFVRKATAAVKLCTETLFGNEQKQATGLMGKIQAKFNEVADTVKPTVKAALLSVKTGLRNAVASAGKAYVSTKRLFGYGKEVKTAA